MFRTAMRRDIVRRSFGVAVVVGTLLNLINQGDRLFDGASVDLFKGLLTYAVPYFVATYGAVSAVRDQNPPRG